jgi:protein O-GlcNAc transferase
MADDDSHKFSLTDLLTDLAGGSAPLTVLDVGAMAVGSAAAVYAPLYDTENLRLIGFEPDEAECRKLNESTDGRFQFYPHFAGDGGAATYYENNFTMTGSLYEPNTPLLENFRTWPN